MKTTATTEEVSSHPGEKGVGSQKWRRNSLLCRRKTDGGLEKRLANLWSRTENHKNRPTLVVGKKPNGKSQMKRDMELIREILQRAESLEFVGDEPYERYWARTPAEAYQIALMKDFGLVEADVETTCGIPSRATIVRLTWAGHDFLDSSRDSKIWKLAKEHIIKPGVSCVVFNSGRVSKTGNAPENFWSRAGRECFTNNNGSLKFNSAIRLIVLASNQVAYCHGSFCREASL